MHVKPNFGTPMYECHVCACVGICNEFGELCGTVRLCREVCAEWVNG